jgi:hypothetical protein
MVALEMIDRCLYTMCALRKDLKLKDVRALMKSSKNIPLPLQNDTECTNMDIDGSEWWRNIAIRPRHSQGQHLTNLQFLIENNLSSPVKEEPVLEENDLSTFSRHDSELSADSGYVSSPQDPYYLATTSLVGQYLEALYSAKTSLAYFAKSALSRARAEFQRLEQDDSLISFLQTMVLSIDDFNAKYETHLSRMVLSDPGASNLTISDEEQRHLIQKFKQAGGRQDEINKKSLQREINELKNREYALSESSDIEHNYKS